MARTVTIAIDGERLRQEFTVRNVAMGDASEKCGFEKSYFSKCSRQNKITKYGIALLDRMYNIKFEDYKIDEPEEEKKSEVPEVTKETPLIITEDTKNVLRDIIYSAVYEAVKRAWSE